MTKPLIMHPLEHSVKKIVSTETSLAKGGKIIVGVSGGPDSIALLHILSALSHSFAFQCIAAYIDHGLRPEETPSEIAYVTQTANQLEMIARIVVVDVQAEVVMRKLSIEHAARELRYRAFAELKEFYQADWIAVGHNADDQIEELLIRLLRGGSRKSLSGMTIARDSIIRPLLKTTKKEIYSYLEDKKISFCIDSSNEDLKFLRNRIRHNLLPVLEKEYDPGIRHALFKTSENLGEDEEFLDSMVDEMFKEIVLEYREKDEHEQPFLVLDRTLFNSYHKALKRRCIEKVLWKVNTKPKYEYILAVVNKAAQGVSGNELHLNRGLRVAIDAKCLTFSYPVGKIPWRGNLKS